MEGRRGPRPPGRDRRVAGEDRKDGKGSGGKEGEDEVESGDDSDGQRKRNRRLFFVAPQGLATSLRFRGRARRRASAPLGERKEELNARGK